MFIHSTFSALWNALSTSVHTFTTLYSFKRGGVKSFCSSCLSVYMHVSRDAILAIISDGQKYGNLQSEFLQTD